jgi:hypothetical protein
VTIGLERVQLKEGVDSRGIQVLRKTLKSADEENKKIALTKMLAEKIHFFLGQHFYLSLRIHPFGILKQKKFKSNVSN